MARCPFEQCQSSQFTSIHRLCPGHANSAVGTTGLSSRPAPRHLFLFTFSKQQPEEIPFHAREAVKRVTYQIVRELSREMLFSVFLDWIEFSAKIKSQRQRFAHEREMAIIQRFLLRVLRRLNDVEIFRAHSRMIVRNCLYRLKHRTATLLPPLPDVDGVYSVFVPPHGWLCCHYRICNSKQSCKVHLQ
jgi:hypothetical protein